MDAGNRLGCVQQQQDVLHTLNKIAPDAPGVISLEQRFHPLMSEFHSCRLPGPSPTCSSVSPVSPPHPRAQRHRRTNQRSDRRRYWQRDSRSGAVAPNFDAVQRAPVRHPLHRRAAKRRHARCTCQLRTPVRHRERPPLPRLGKLHRMATHHRRRAVPSRVDLPMYRSPISALPTLAHRRRVSVSQWSRVCTLMEPFASAPAMRENFLQQVIRRTCHGPPATLVVYLPRRWILATVLAYGGVREYFDEEGGRLRNLALKVRRATSASHGEKRKLQPCHFARGNANTAVKSTKSVGDIMGRDWEFAFSIASRHKVYQEALETSSLHSRPLI